MSDGFQVSLFSSSNRPKLWNDFFKSLQRTELKIEVVFAGPIKQAPECSIGVVNFKFITTEDIKPSQCYEIARRKCTGETIVWVADDCEFPNLVLDKAYEYWKNQNNDKLILSIQTKESGYKNNEGSLFNMNHHRFFGGDNNTPLMAPLAFMSRIFLEELGGIDRRYICGQYENDIVMRAYNQGAKVEIFGSEDCYIDIDHLRKSIMIGESTNEDDFLNRPFAQGYNHDRMILETSWCKQNIYNMIKNSKIKGRPVYKWEVMDVLPHRIDDFEPFSNNISLIQSEGPSGRWK